MLELYLSLAAREYAEILLAKPVLTYEKEMYCGCYLKSVNSLGQKDPATCYLDSIQKIMEKEGLEFLPDTKHGTGFHITIINSNNRPTIEKDDSTEVVYGIDLNTIKKLPRVLSYQFADKLSMLGYKGNISIIAPINDIDKTFLRMHNKLKEEYNLTTKHDYLPHITLGVFDKRYEKQVLDFVRTYQNLDVGLFTSEVFYRLNDE